MAPNSFFFLDNPRQAYSLSTQKQKSMKEPYWLVVDFDDGCDLVLKEEVSQKQYPPHTNKLVYKVQSEFWLFVTETGTELAYQKKPNDLNTQLVWLVDYPGSGLMELTRTKNIMLPKDIDLLTQVRPHGVDWVWAGGQFNSFTLWSRKH